ncbi:MAG: metallopeptidase TldD-related protein, partial [Nanoarchaeota archaeon]
EEELIEGIKLGVYIRDFTEWNIDDKRFQQKYVGSDAYLVENGKIKYPVLKPVLELTTPKLWSSIDAVGKNLEYHTGTCGKGEPMQGVPAFLGGPSIRIRNVVLG